MADPTPAVTPAPFWAYYLHDLITLLITSGVVIWRSKLLTSHTTELREESHEEHGATAKKVEEIHLQLNGGLQARIEEAIDKRLGILTHLDTPPPR